MSVLWYDGLSNYPGNRASTALATIWSIETAYSGEVTFVDTAYGRMARLYPATSFSYTAMVREFAPISAMSFGFNFMIEGFAGAAGQPTFALSYRNGAARNWGTQGALVFCLRNNGMIEVRLQAGIRSAPSGTKLGEFGPITPGLHYFLTVQYVISNSGAGRLKVILDNKIVLNIWDTNTQLGSVSAIDGFYCGTDLTNYFPHIGNIWFDSDPNVSEHRRVGVYFPNADVSTSGFVPSTGTSLAACVDETPINTGDYIAGSAVGNKAELGFQDPVGLKGISAVSARAWVSKSDTADRSVIARLKSSGSSVASAAYSIPTAMTRLDVTSEVDPSTGLPWTVAGLAGASWELEVAA